MMMRSSIFVMFLAMAAAQYSLVWSDEFNGTSLDLTKWNFEVNCDGGGNNELQCYTSNAANLNVSNGQLHINAKIENLNNKQYTSARITTQASSAWKYGRFDTRAKLPNGQYLWPALWMMPRDSVYGGWAASGEIDIMEFRGGKNFLQESTIHYGGSWPNNIYEGSGPTNFSTDLTADFHVYSLVWTPTNLQFLVDDVVFHTETLQRGFWSGRGSNPYTADGQPFDQPFFFIINLAIGGMFFGAEANSLTTDIASKWANPTLTIDYVRVSQLKDVVVPPGPAPTVPAGTTVSSGYDGPKPIVYYSFDKFTTNVTDDSGNGHTGVLTGPGATIYNGKYNKALSLSQTSGVTSVQVTNGSFIAGAFTVSVWVNIATQRDVRMKIASSKTGWNDATGWQLECYPTQNSISFVGAGDSVAFWGGLPITYGQFFHVAVVVDTNMLATLYFNGVLQSSIGIYRVQPAVQNLFVGSDSGINAVTGFLDEFYLFSASLKASQVVAVMNNAANTSLWAIASTSTTRSTTSRSTSSTSSTSTRSTSATSTRSTSTVQTNVISTSPNVIVDTRTDFNNLIGSSASTIVPLGIMLLSIVLIM